MIIKVIYPHHEEKKMSIEKFLKKEIQDDDVKEFFSDLYNYIEMPNGKEIGMGEIINAFSSKTEWASYYMDYFDTLLEDIKRCIETGNTYLYKSITIKPINNKD